MGREVTPNPGTSAANNSGTPTVKSDETTTRLTEIANELRAVKIHRNSIPTWPLLHELGFSTDNKTDGPVFWATKLSDIAQKTNSIRLELQKTTQHPENINLSLAKEISDEIEVLQSLIERQSNQYIMDWEKLSVEESARNKNRATKLLPSAFPPLLALFLHHLDKIKMVPFPEGTIPWVTTIGTVFGTAFVLHLLHVIFSWGASARICWAAQRRARIALQLMMPQSPTPSWWKSLFPLRK
ncbi:hypothetical protein NR798_29745 [Archangium gephyra]|uniref:hypothetical protein n=1 Tax=Archangium gephyra TaxID=48 RepID=UPI0035D5114F